MAEEGVRVHLESIAAEQGWKSARDDAGNLVLYVPGRGAGRKSPPLAIQGHMDMVCTKRNEVEHDFATDSIELMLAEMDIDGSPHAVLRAKGTTLGSDNGIGLAAGLAVALDSELDRPPLELIFTADEEAGMSGAEGLDPGLVHAKRLLNLDAEEHGSVYLSCAGGRDLIAQWALEREEVRADDIPVRVVLEGLAGGHSGVDIHLGRRNAIVALVNALCEVETDFDGVRLGRIDGGGQDNAIPRRAELLLWCAKHRAAPLCEEIRAHFEAMREDLEPKDLAGLRIKTEIGDEAERDALSDYGPLSATMSRTILKVLRAVPDGVISMSEAIPDLVESSSNLGIISTGPDHVRLVLLTRSSKSGALETIQGRMELSMEAAGAEVEFDNGWPGWEADLENPLLAQTVSTYQALFATSPQIKAIHGGLECGYLSQRLPGVHMVAFGPEIRNAHTPDESVVLDSVEPFFMLVRQLVRDLCRT